MKHQPEKIALLKKLFAGCPFLKDLPNCPARNIRKLTPDNQAKLLEQMSEENIKSILQHHSNCMAQ